MALEEIISVQYLPHNGFENPVELKLKKNILEIAYLEGGIHKQRHSIAADGKTLGYEILRLNPFPQHVKDEFINIYVKQNHGLVFDINSIDKESREKLMDVLMQNPKFYSGYRELFKGYYEPFKEIQLIEGKRTLNNQQFNDIISCYRILKDALQIVKSDEIRKFIQKAVDFNQCLLLPYRNGLDENQKNNHRN